MVKLQATQAPSANYATSLQQATFIVSSAALSAVANNATRVYGAANPAFTGKIAGAVYNDTFTENFSTTAVLASPVGPYTIVPSASGANLADYNVTATNGVLTITQAAATLALTASASSIHPSQSVTFTAVASSTTTGTPTGTVTFYDNGAALDTVSLVNGTSALTTSSLSPNTVHAIPATYSGDTNFLGANAASPVSETTTSLDFSFTARA